MDWKFLFTSFDGRISRQPFWVGSAVLFAAQLVLQFLFGDGFIGLLLAIALIYPSFAVLVKRCHDRGKSGWWSLIALIPVVGLIWAIVDLGILPGTAGRNSYGQDPLAV